MTNKKIGIYKILNIENENFYIGSSVNINKRKYRHFFELERNIHNNEHLQRAYNKYGEKAFKFEIIEVCEKDLLINKEQYYIDKLEPSYNICKIAYSTLGVIPSKETRLKMSKSPKGRKHTKESKLKMSISGKGKIISEKQRLQVSVFHSKPILQYDLNMNFIKEYKS